MQNLTGLSPIISRYDALLLDVWGVVHDGSHLYPEVHGTLEKLRDAGKKIIFLSNAPRRARKVEVVLNQLGIEPGLYHGVISSGEAGFQWLKEGKAPGKRYFYIGPAKDLDVLDGLDYQRVDDMKDADFLLNVGFGSEEESAEDWQGILSAAKGQGLSMLCLNPDFEVVKISGERFACAGVLAADYEKLGGKVQYFGKPFPEVYARCMELLGNPVKAKVLAVGDGIATDIAGAADFDIDSLLVMGGILKKQADQLEALCKKHGAVPNYTIPELRW